MSVQEALCILRLIPNPKVHILKAIDVLKDETSTEKQKNIAINIARQSKFCIRPSDLKMFKNDIDKNLRRKYYSTPKQLFKVINCAYGYDIDETDVEDTLYNYVHTMISNKVPIMDILHKNKPISRLLTSDTIFTFHSSSNHSCRLFNIDDIQQVLTYLSNKIEKTCNNYIKVTKDNFKNIRDINKNKNLIIGRYVKCINCPLQLNIPNTNTFIPCNTKITFELFQESLNNFIDNNKISKEILDIIRGIYDITKYSFEPRRLQTKCPQCDTININPEIENILTGVNIKSVHPTYIKCENVDCNYEYCADCFEPFHTNKICDGFTKSEKKLLYKGLQKCVGCNNGIEKNGGCTTVTCIKCFTIQCYKCRVKRLPEATQLMDILYNPHICCLVGQGKNSKLYKRMEIMTDN
jgi:hypothetical protein